RPDGARSGLAELLVLANAALLVVLLIATCFYGYSELRWSTLIVVAGLVLLFAPGLFEALPMRLRDGRAGLVALAGVQAVALTALAKVGGLSWAKFSWVNLS